MPPCEGVRRGEAAYHPLPVPRSYREGVALNEVVPGNVACVYARIAADLRQGTQTAPGFEDAVALHRLLEAIEASAGSGTRLSPTGAPFTGARGKGRG